MIREMITDRRLWHCPSSSSSSTPSTSEVGEEVNVEVLFPVPGAQPVVRTVPAIRTLSATKNSLHRSNYEPGYWKFPRKPRTPVIDMGYVPKPKRAEDKRLPGPIRDVIVREFFGGGGDGGGENIRLLVEKKLFKTDLARGQNRLSMPQNKLKLFGDEFLTAKEEAVLRQRKKGPRGGLMGITVSVLVPCLRRTTMELKKWDNQPKTSRSYVLIRNWCNVATNNGLKKGHVIQVWFFRDVDRNPCFALVPLNHHSRDHVTKRSPPYTSCNESNGSSGITTD